VLEISKLLKKKSFWLKISKIECLTCGEIEMNFEIQGQIKPKKSEISNLFVFPLNKQINGYNPMNVMPVLKQ
jgi:hypothetical protein